LKNYRKHIDDFFREKLGRYRETPPSDVWDDLEGKLDILKPYVPKPPVRWLWHLSLVSLIAVLGVSLTRKFMSTPKESQPAVEQTTVTATQPTQTAQSPSVAGEQQAAANGSGAPDQADMAVAGAANSVNGTTNNVAAESKVGNSIGNTSADEHGNANNGGANNAAYAHVGSAKQRAAGEVKYSTQDVSAAIEANRVAADANSAARRANMTSGTSVFTAATHNNGNGNRALTTATRKTQFSAGNTDNAAKSVAKATENDNVVSVSAPGQINAGAIQQQVNTGAQAPANADAAKDAAAKAKAKQKELAAADVKKQAEKEQDKQNKKHGAKHFDFGVKGGYEMGIGSQLANKWVIAPYVQYHLSSKVALMTQPGVKYATIADRSVGSAASYYAVNQDGKVVQGATTISVKVIGSNVDTYYHTKYTYSQSHDSIVKTKNYGGSYVEYEIPLLVQYGLTRKLSVYGGVNLVYSQRTMVNEHTNTYSNIVRSVDTTITNAGAAGTAPALSSVVTYTGNPLGETNNTTYPMKVDNIFRMGYMVGVSYQYTSRWLFDAMMQQTPMKPDVRDGFNVNKTLSAPYLRLSVGYKISK
jgi:hypothetical protein